MEKKYDPTRVLYPGEAEKIILEDREEGLKFILKNYGALIARLAMLNIALKENLSKPYSKNYPPSVFIAYKWEDEKHQEWIKTLSVYLKSRGYRVYLDQDHLEKTASNFHEVPQYIANMVNCDIFLIVVTEKYLDYVEERHNQTTWVHDEYNAAVALHGKGKLKIYSLWKEPGVIPKKLLLRWDVVDMRSEPENFKLIDAFFPSYHGPTITVDEKQTLLNFIEKFDITFETEYDSGKPDIQKLTNLLVRYKEFETLYDYKYRLTKTYWLGNLLDEAYQVALEIKDESDDDFHILHLAQVFDAVQDYATMFRFLYKARTGFKLKDSVQYHYFVAETLYELNSVFAARNHFGWLMKFAPLEAMGDLLKNTIRTSYEELSKLISEGPVEHLFRCTNCEAEYIFLQDLQMVCGECNTLYEKTEKVCPVCSNNGRVPLQTLLKPENREIVSVECPVCNEGQMNIVF